MKNGGIRKERVSWSRAEEESLLTLYARARRDPTLRGENGLRMKGWRWLAGEMVARYGAGKDKPVIQSKFARLMREYKLYQWLLKHAALAPRDDGEIEMDEPAWQRVYATRRADVSVLRRFRQQRGFPQAKFCALALADDGVLEPVPNASEHDHDDDDDDYESATATVTTTTTPSEHELTPRRAAAAMRAQPTIAPAPLAGSIPVVPQASGAKRGRPPNSALQQAEAQRQRQRVAQRVAVELAPIQHGAAPALAPGRLFSPELEAKLSRCLDVVTAYFEASTAVLSRMGSTPANGLATQE